MNYSTKIAVALMALTGAPSVAADPPAAATPDIYSNEEQVYFAKEAGQPVPPLIAVKVWRAGTSAMPDAASGHFVDMFGNPASPLSSDGKPMAAAAVLNAVRKNQHPQKLTVTMLGQSYDLRRARAATCWVAIRKDKPRPDGKEDWFFAQGVTMHDQGGRALVGAGTADTQPVVIRMRNVVWPPKSDGTPNNNKPSIVLYIHKPDQPDRAESYVWGDPGAARIGINLRWMQASCGIDGMENPSAVTATNFRG